MPAAVRWCLLLGAVGSVAWSTGDHTTVPQLRAHLDKNPQVVPGGSDPALSGIHHHHTSGHIDAVLAPPPTHARKSSHTHTRTRNSTLAPAPTVAPASTPDSDQKLSHGGSHGQPPLCAGADPLLTQLLEAEGLGEVVRNNSMGFWVGISGSLPPLSPSTFPSPTPHKDQQLPRSAGAALGWSDPTAVPPKLAALTDVVPSGSLTKTFTAAAVMRLVDAGEIDLDEPVVPFANIVLIRQGHTSLGDLYPPIISNVSFRDLLSMRSGLSDYGSSAVHVATETELDVDLNPIAYLLNDTLTPKKTIWR